MLILIFVKLLYAHFLLSSSAQAPHKRYDSNKEEDAIVDIIQDHDVDKYKRRSALHWFARWFK